MISSVLALFFRPLRMRLALLLVVLWGGSLLGPVFTAWLAPSAVGSRVARSFESPSQQPTRQQGWQQVRQPTRQQDWQQVRQPTRKQGWRALFEPAVLQAQELQDSGGQPPKRQGSPAQKPRRASRSKSSGKLIEMNFRNVEIPQFLNLMSRALDIAFVWDENVIRGKITLISPRKFNKEDAYRIFLTVLGMQGFTTLRPDDSPVIQVIRTRDANREPSPVQDGAPERGRTHNEFITQIIPLKYADASQIQGLLRGITSKTAALAVYKPANLLVLADNQTNVRRVLDIIKALDVPPEELEFELVKLQHAEAKKLEPVLKSIVQALGGEKGGGASSSGKSTRSNRAERNRSRASSGSLKNKSGGAGGNDLQIISDERTNTLILVGSSESLAKYREVLAALDVPGESVDSGFKVFHLQYANAEDLAKTLQSVKSAEVKSSGEGGKKKATQRQAASNQLIAADKPTNSLIVFGSPSLLRTMTEMVARLDVRRPQVFVEALIMELTLEKSLQLGVRWQSLSPSGDGLAGVGVPSAAPLTLADTVASGSSAVVGIVGNQIDFAGQSFSSFAAFVQANRQDQDLNILANPQILTVNNEEAQINVSQVVPVSAKVVTSTNSQTTTQFEFKDIGIILKIKPQITGTDKIRLTIDQESSSVAARQTQVSSTQQAITTLKRSINTQVLVDDNTTVAIGGLIQDQQVQTEAKVPCLGDIPVVGWFFRSRTEELRKTNLIVFIRPRILNSPADAEALSREVTEEHDAGSDPRAPIEETLRQKFELPAAPSTLAPKPEQPSNATQEGDAATPSQ